MNETIQNILTRRSVRNFDPERLPSEEQIQQIVECGKYSANGMGYQHTKMLVVTNREVRDRISRLHAEILGTGAEILDADGAVKKAVFGVAVQMHEIGHAGTPGLDGR